MPNKNKKPSPPEFIRCYVFKMTINEFAKAIYSYPDQVRAWERRGQFGRLEGVRGILHAAKHLPSFDMRWLLDVPKNWRDYA